jgi:predicted transcriptional regulator
MEIKQLMKKYAFSEEEITLYFLVSKNGKINIDDIESSCNLTRLQIHSATEALLEKGIIKLKLGRDRSTIVESLGGEVLYQYLKAKAKEEVDILKQEIINIDSTVLPQIKKLEFIKIINLQKHFRFHLQSISSLVILLSMVITSLS